MVTPVAVVFVRHVVADGAACDGSQNTVMDEVACNSADDGALDAAPGLCRRSRCYAKRGDNGKSEDEFLHAATPIPAGGK